jgi:CheY-like chemotaxis protein
MVHRRAEKELDLLKADVAVVEDDDSVREATNHLSRLLGYAVASFASAENFLKSGCARDMACLIADVQLLGMSGVKALHTIPRQPRISGAADRREHAILSVPAPPKCAKLFSFSQGRAGASPRRGAETDRTEKSA